MLNFFQIKYFDVDTHDHLILEVYTSLANVRGTEKNYTEVPSPTHSKIIYVPVELKRQTPNFWIHALLCFGVWICAILAFFESMFLGAIIAFVVGWALMALAGCCSDLQTN